MKTIKFPEITFRGMEDKDVIYELTKIRLNAPPKQGFNPEQMRKRIKILGIVSERETHDTIELEDADYEVLKNCVNGDGWGVLDEDVLKYIDAINDAKGPGAGEAKKE